MAGRDEVRTATRAETAAVGAAALLVGVVALVVCLHKGILLLYGDSVAHLGIARRLLDSRQSAMAYLVGVWLPLPHLLMMPFAQRTEWWQNGLAGALPSLGCYAVGVAGFFRLCRRVLAPRWASAATAFYGLNPNLLYLSTTAMTEPVFLMLTVWMTLVTVELAEAIGAGDAAKASRRLVGLGVLVLAGVFTRYDGWVLGATVWCAAAWQVWRARAVGREVRGAFAVFTLLALAGPALWLGLEWHMFRDPLWFMRGPYSAVAVEKNTAGWWPLNYLGLHNPVLALLIYMRTAQLDAAVWEAGFAVMAAALAGLWIAARRRAELGAGWWSVLLWVPLGFYTYSIAYGSVPIFVPEIWPYAHYNVRYGVELLPALALFGSVAVAALEARMGRPRAMYGAVLGLVGLNALGMIYGTAAAQATVRLAGNRPAKWMEIYAPPLVLREAVVNSMWRVPFERDVARVLEGLPSGSTILMGQAEHMGVLQDAGIALRQTVNQNDLSGDQLTQEVPARLARYVVAYDGDPLAAAVARRPQGLEEIKVVCGTGVRCARIYRSTDFAGE
jgi:hypothetical protein